MKPRDDEADLAAEDEIKLDEHEDEHKGKTIGEKMKDVGGTVKEKVKEFGEGAKEFIGLKEREKETEERRRETD